MRMPDLVLSSRQVFADFLGKQVTKLPMIRLQLLVVFCNLRIHAPVHVLILQNDARPGQKHFILKIFVTKAVTLSAWNRFNAQASAGTPSYTPSCIDA